MPVNSGVATCLSSRRSSCGSEDIRKEELTWDVRPGPIVFSINARILSGTRDAMHHGLSSLHLFISPTPVSL